MSVKILKCEKCGNYFLSETCPICGGKCVTPEPPKFSLEDKYGKYRRIAKESERKSNGLI
ncbi:MAG: RNA-protein complex protein Nop10 [Nitrospiraceae bacterium]|nr:RNA-protein complex protein Nop10 [Nitrospiraceae bacterium]